jgi:hypothetical protein
MAMNAYQVAISRLARSLGLSGSREAEIYSRPEFQTFLNQWFGAIPLPPGVDPSQVITNTGSVLEYRDAQGYVHRFERELR